MIDNSQQGVSLYYAIVIMSVALVIVLGLNTIAIKSLKTTREIKKSPVALYAADTGIEEALYKATVTGDWDLGFRTDDPIELDNGAKYTVEILATSTSPCDQTDASMYCIYSTGSYRGSQRMLRVVR